MSEDEADDDDFEMQECCYAAEESGESHYHCSRCNEVVSMMGHWDGTAFDCEESRG